MLTLKRTLLGAAAGVLLSAGPASAFYFNGWPGSGEPITRTLIPPKSRDVPGNPVGTPPTGSPTPVNPPGGNPPPILITPQTPGEQPPPEHVPEPAAGLLGLIGLSAAVAARWRKRRS
jgi:MYXO-CTERM domain-containing protein